MNGGWIYLIIASISEVAWVYSVKYMRFRDIFKMHFTELFAYKNLSLILPLLGYIIFGIGNIILFSKAMKTIPAGIAYSVWMSVALVFIKITDVTIFKQPITLLQVIFILLILTGIAGLKITE